MPAVRYIFFATVVAAVNAASAAMPSMMTPAPMSTDHLPSASSTSLGPGTTVFDVFHAFPTGVPLGDQFAFINGFRGSIVNANALATTIAMDCLPDAVGCLIKEPITITEGPSTFTMLVSSSTNYLGAEAFVTFDEACQISDKTQATCTASARISAHEGGKSTATSTVLTETYSGQEVTYSPLTVTAGVSKLHRPQATETPAGGIGGNGAAGRAGIGGAAVAAAAGAVIGLL